jgi:hypothetical protein
MQNSLLARRIFTWASSGHFWLAIFWFETSPQLGQERILTTMRPC